MEDLFEVPDVQCCGCNEDISFSDHVRCTECYKETVNFCIKCFQTGTEFGSHKRGHNYKVEHPLGSVMFTHSNESNPWGWKEDKMLIRALNKYKLTHWSVFISSRSKQIMAIFFVIAYVDFALFWSC
ncbi:hypothetical protein AB6A40_000994 [Gnathostoma spinigerum]|uniref:ZZ-type domain-containing protein n=1 Tax=Gnathostoma spinigerum TaxID=75299 RepID=A0ABD6E373_9BILA